MLRNFKTYFKITKLSLNKSKGNLKILFRSKQQLKHYYENTTTGNKEKTNKFGIIIKSFCASKNPEKGNKYLQIKYLSDKRLIARI